MIRIIKRVCITEKGTNKSKNIKLSIIGAKLSKRSDIFNWGQIVHNWDIIVRIKYKDYIYYTRVGGGWSIFWVTKIFSTLRVMAVTQILESLLTPRIPNSSSPRPSVRHKTRHLAISREPRVVEYIRWCQNDRKNMKKIMK